jgi:cell division transport system ATP-binding protein
LLIADEPTGNVDDDIALLLVRVFERINRLGTTVLIATHDIAFARQFEHRRYHLDQGMLLEAGTSLPQ